MRWIVLGARSSLVAIVITGLIGLPTMGAGGSLRPLATVVWAEPSAWPMPMPFPGADVYFYDDLVTQGGGSLRLLGW